MGIDKFYNKVLNQNLYHDLTSLMISKSQREFCCLLITQKINERVSALASEMGCENQKIKALYHDKYHLIDSH